MLASTRNFFFVFVALCLVPSVQAADGFSLFFQTPAINDRLGSFVAVDAGSFDDISQLGPVVGKYKTPDGFELAPGAEEKVEVVVVVPKGAPQAYVTQYLEQVQGEVSKLYPNSSFSFQTSYLDTDKEFAEYETETKFLRQEAAQSPTEKDFLEQRQNQIQHDAANLRLWVKSWMAKPLAWLNNRNPVNRTIAARVVGATKFGVASTVLISKYGVDLVSGALGFYNGAVTFAFGYYATEFSQWSTTHSFFLTKRFPWLEKMQPLGFLGLNFKPLEFYNKSPEVKSFSINIFRSLGLAYVARTLAYMTHRVNRSTGAAVESPNNLQFLVEGAGLTLFETLGDTAMDVGLRSLTQKGYLTYSSRSYLLWVISISDTLMHTFFRSGDTSRAYLMLAINSVGKASIYVLSKMARRQNKKIVIISDKITRGSDDFKHVIRRTNMGEAMVTNPESEKLAKLRNPDATLREVADALNIIDISSGDLAKIHESIVSGTEPVRACVAFLKTSIPTPTKAQ